MKSLTWLQVLLTAACLAGVAPRDGHAQLISPGELSTAHADLEGMRNCTNCHELRQRGVAETLCLACHQPLAAQMTAGRGYHATLDESCGSCHKEHGGRDLDIVRFDSLTFEHESQAGFALTGAHSEATCRDCHTPPLITTPAVRLFKREHGTLDKTYLGVGTECRSCHLLEDPHDRQFEGQVCSDCHDETSWTPAPGFDHEDTNYPLTGLHGQVACESCHSSSTTPGGTSVRYAPLSFGACTSCHVDYHEGSMSGVCQSCHSTAGWGVDQTSFEGGFDHSSTGFELVGAHGAATCSQCHDQNEIPATMEILHAAATRGRQYARPVVEDCLSCHVDQHAGAFADVARGPVCSSCHGEETWLPTMYDLFRHNEETAFELTGAHLATTCAACHDDIGSVGSVEAGVPQTFVIADQTCAGCHTDDDPHAGQFVAQSCTDCHTTTTFDIAAFDHDSTRYPLDEAHREVPCAGCHLPEPDPRGGTVVRYAPLDTTCRSCHEGPS